MKLPIYLDYNATTPVDPQVAAALRPFLENEFGNPSSAHARQAVAAARAELAALGCEAVRARGAVRLSVGRTTTAQEITAAATALVGAWRKIAE